METKAWEGTRDIALIIFTQVAEQDLGMVGLKPAGGVFKCDCVCC